MIKLYLITGFLGAGKTTLLKNLITIFSSKKLSVIVNEFGKAGIDGSLIKTTGVYLDEINNGSIFCACRFDKFEDTLEQHINLSPEIIIVEASGLSDPTSIKKILSQNDKFSEIDYAGCICLVDAVNFKKVINTAKVCKRQISISDIIIINKIDSVNIPQLEEIRTLVLSQKPTAKLYETNFSAIELDWIINIKKSELPIEGYHIKDVSLQKFLITVNSNFTEYQLRKFIEMFIDTTYRIKGFVEIEGKIHLVDCTSLDVNVTPFTDEINCLNEIVVLAGALMDTQKQIDYAVKWYSDKIVSVE